MKIGIIGTHGVGKDGIISFLGHYCKQLSLHFDSTPEVARYFANQGFPINKDATLELEEAFQYQQAANEKLFEHRMKIGSLHHFACNRVRLDNYAYAEDLLGDIARQHLYGPMVEWMRSHPSDILIKVPIWKKEIVKDDIRDLDPIWQRSIEEKIDQLLDETKIPHEIFPTEIFLLGENNRAGRKMESAALGEYFDNIFETYAKK